jgi:HdeA/HdeB family
MRLCFVLALAAIALAGADLSAPARAQSFPCDAFVRNPDGSWTAMQEARVPAAGRVFNIRAGSVLRPGATMMGLDMSAVLAEECRNAPVGMPASTPPAPPPSVSESPAALSRLTDANGQIDVQRLTCAQLAETPQAEADFLLLWHSGWYNAMAKRRVIDLPRVKEGIRNVMLYCKANRDKGLVQAMDLYLKDRR